MKERKFKIGDKVKLNPDVKVFGYGRGCVSYDETGKIIGTKESGVHFGDYKVKFPSHYDWCGLEHELVLANKPVQSIHIYSDGKTTTAVLKEGKKVVKESKATCHEDDEFNFETGAKLAFERLLEDSKEYKEINKEIKREANVGEYIKITNANKFCHIGYENGDILRVTKKDLDGDVYGEDTVCIRDNEYVVLDGYKQKEKQTETEIKIGDMVVVINCGECYSTYTSWFEENNCEQFESHYVSGTSLINSMKLKVVAIGKPSYDKYPILAVQNQETTQVFLIGLKGVKKVA